MKTKRLNGTPIGRRYKIAGLCDTPKCFNDAVEVFRGKKHCAECLNPSTDIAVPIQTQKSALGFAQEY